MSDNDFSVLHVNIRSVQKNFENLKFLLSQLNYTFKVVCLSETWCKEGKSIPQLENFNLVFQNRQTTKKGGGFLIFIHNSLNFTKTSATAIDHIITNSIFLSSITTGIIKTDITDHMPIFLTSHQKNFDIYPQDTYIYKRYINNNTIEQFKTTIHCKP